MLNTHGNPAKYITSGLNYLNGTRLLISGSVKIGVGILSAETVAGAIFSGLYGAYQINAAFNAFERGSQLWDEAGNECLKDMNERAIYGLFPEGTKYDDKNEPVPMDYLLDHYINNPYKLIKDFFTFSF